MPYARTSQETRSVDRVLFGKAPANTTNPIYHRSNEYGLFVSKPGANVMDCNASSLIFDSTGARSISQTIASGFVSIPAANLSGLPTFFGLFDLEAAISHTGNIVVYTGVEAPIWPQQDTPLMCWVNFQDANGSYITNWPQVSSANSFVSIGTDVSSVKVKTYVNALAGNTVDIKFDNGLHANQAAYWTLFKEPGATAGEADATDVGDGS